MAAILFIVAFIFLGTWFVIGFRRVLLLLLAPILAIACFMWGLNFVGDTPFIATKFYGWWFILLGCFSGYCFLIELHDTIEDICLYFKP